VALNPPSQYADDRNLRARQRLWGYQEPYFDLVSWVLDIAQVAPGLRVLDVGCGNGAYLRALGSRGVAAVGCDLSQGMLRVARPHPVLVNGDASALPLRSEVFDVALASHMLYHLQDREAAVHELRRVLRPGGVCVAVTNGAHYLGALRALVEAAVRRGTPGWEMPGATHLFSLDNGANQLGVAFASVTCVRPTGVGPVIIRDADIVADYVASVGDRYQEEVVRPWSGVVEDVRAAVREIIASEGAFVLRGDPGAFICR
jgi:SAM-dependent methyltransferase